NAIGGSIILNNITNDFVGAIHANATYDIEIYNSNSTVLGNVTGVNFQFISAGGSITQIANSSLLISGTTNLTASGNTITLNSPTNNFNGNVSAFAADIALRDSNAIQFGQIRTTGNLTITSAGAISQPSGNVITGGTANFITSGTGVNGNITLDSSTNDFNILTACGTNLTLAEQNNATLNNIFISGTVNITAANVATINSPYSAANTVVSGGTVVTSYQLSTNLTVAGGTANILTGGNVTGSAIRSSGSLISNGSFGSLSLNGGTLYTTSNGTLVRGNLAFGAGSTWNATGPSKANFSMISVNGGVSINSGAILTLTVPGNMSYPEGLTLINQSGSSLISQTSGFSGLPQGSFFTSNNTALQINYNGQAGNYTANSSGNDLIVRLSTRFIDVMTQCLTTTANSSFAGGLKFRVVGGAGNSTVVANVPITIILPANVNYSNTASGRFDNANAANRSITVYTDSNGNATVPIWANENPGPFQVNITQADDTSITNYPFMGVIGVAVQQQSRNRSFVRYMD
ncbi:MAG: beta strand repeat-containing protein, partial [Isosphaeraceae bacterium]